MKSTQQNLMDGTVEVDETVIGGQEKGTRGRKNKSKNLVVVGIEKKKKGVSRLYARVIANADSENLAGFIEDHISPQSQKPTDKWTAYQPLKKSFEN